MITFTERGLYCAQADVYIDPWKPVKHALITHGHADHARAGSQRYLATHAAVPVIDYRLKGPQISGIDYGKTVTIHGVKISFHPAGHIIGSAQIRLEYKGEVWVISGDYKTEYDGISEPYEPVKCHHFVTESTFGLPVFRWQSQKKVISEIEEWWTENQTEGVVSVIHAYALGKAQRIIHSLDSIGRIYTHGAVENINEVLRGQGYNLKETIRVTPDHTYDDFKGSLVIATSSGIQSEWSKRFKEFSSAVASGWVAMRGTRRRRAADRGFVLSDHADWTGLMQAIKETEAENIYVTHGYTDIFSKYLREQGYNAQVVKTEFSSNEEETEEVQK